MLNNLRWRREIIRFGNASKENAYELWVMCARDILFWFNTFVWTYDPRRTDNNVVPMITYPFQDIAIMQGKAAIETPNDLLWEKSRDQGGSIMTLGIYLWMFQFRERESFLVASRKEDLVDKKDDPDCLFWKLDFMLEHQPAFIRPKVNRLDMHLYNYNTKSVIDGTSTTGDIGRGGRRRSVLLDEFASVPNSYSVMAATRDVTRCRFFLSTPKGRTNAFGERAHNAKVKKISLHWSLHPEKNPGLYKSVGHELIILDTAYRFPEKYQFVLDGKLRSPWYDGEEARVAHPLEMAQEVDINYLGSESQFFNAMVVEELMANVARRELFIGDLSFNSDHNGVEPLGFYTNPNGKLRLWVNLRHDGKAPPGGFVIGGDVAAGTGASNSVLSVVNDATHEKVAEYANPNITPEEFGRFAVALCKFFNNAYLIWESNGPGTQFGTSVLRAGYRNIYYRKSNDISVSAKFSDKPGWHSTTENKGDLLGFYRSCLASRDFVNYSIEALQETLFYVYDPGKGGVVHAESRSSEVSDPSGAEANHGDRVIGDALACKIACKALGAPIVEKAPVALPGSIAYRRLQDAKVGKDEWS
jgi:hypothetical protein